MKTRFLLLAALAFIFAGCSPTRILTVSPRTSGYHTYSTTVTVPGTHTMTTTARVSAVDDDISLYLDLQAVGAAFAQSSTIEEFERLLNNASYMLSNLDLNGDGYVDYLRVVETMEGRNHVFLIQAVLDSNIYQDVATLVTEVTSVSKYYVQVIGAPYIYGPAYIVEPVYFTTPAIIAHLLHHAYRPWHSPWYWGHFPPHYKHPAPVFLSHYHAYIHTYMTNHRYCHEFHYATVYHYPDYERLCRANQRNDYGVKHPERSFSVRTADIPAVRNAASASQGASRVVNARSIRESYDASTVRRTTDTRSASEVRSTTGASRASSSTSRSSAVATEGASRSTSSAVRSASTGNSGNSSQTIREDSQNKRSTATTGSTARTSSSSSASRSSQTTTRSNTTVSSRVSTSGSADTRISTSTPSGTTTVRRSTGTTTTTPASSSTARRSSATSSSSSSRSTSSSTSTVRSTGSSSTRSSSASSGSASRTSSAASGSSSRSGASRSR